MIPERKKEMPKLQIQILEDKQSLGRTAAEHAARSFGFWLSMKSSA